ncbi:hypothetical protein BKH43_04690 [Helicobacter sp. 13S00401-1]|uniref:hypothetical protein n=1 Tax=Helicobacter sp. 13S00401-1 TaxID=1905758 RepID=UPI000BA6D0AD|nr:hypothetical protein [Helicobacter sp. 13S00401-1]PAF50392.1 hypothetical protein BKH43_04690 [Helicobacter sp. 13S00401-1]
MKVLILENETYLAQSISSKLGDNGHSCTIVSSVEEALNKPSNFDALLLSTSVAGSQCKDIILKFRDSIIILLASYVSDDTVMRPLLLGAKDYIIKPFIMDEVIRKIEHYKECEDLKTKIRFLRSYFAFIENELQVPNLPQYAPPILIKANSQRSADIYAMKYAREKQTFFKFLNLKSIDWNEYNFDDNEIYYITNFEYLKKQEKKDFLDFALKKKFIISMISDDKVIFPQIVDITSMANNLEIGSEILSVKDYERIVISKFEGRYPDVELAKKLGMSRKSLWEKRKKYGILKKKN